MAILMSDDSSSRPSTDQTVADHRSADPPPADPPVAAPPAGPEVSLDSPPEIEAAPSSLRTSSYCAPSYQHRVLAWRGEDHAARGTVPPWLRHIAAIVRAVRPYHAHVNGK